MNQDEQQWQTQDHQRFTMEAVEALHRVRQACGDEVASDLASKLGISEAWQQRTSGESK